MNRSFMRFISLMLCLCMVVGMLPGFTAAALAEEMEDISPAEEAAFYEEAEVAEPEQLEEEEPPAEPEEQPAEEIPESSEPAETEPADEEVPCESVDSPEEEPTEPEVPAEDGSKEPEEPAEEENTEPEESARYPWEEMTDEAFAAFVLAGAYLAYEGDAEAAVSLLDRAARVEDEETRRILVDILRLWLEPGEEDGEMPEEQIPYASAGQLLTLDEINTPDMFFKQSVRGTCTLTSSAMLIRRAARMNGNPDWASVTEEALRPYAWIEGTGLRYNFSYAGINVGHVSISGWTLQHVVDMLAAHPEGFVAYNANKPHAVLITDYTGGVVYCADPGTGGGRMPLTSSLLGIGNQDASIAAFTAYWYVTSPKLYLMQKPDLNEVPMTLNATVQTDGKVYLQWNNAYAAGYWIYRSESPNGPWNTPYYNAGVGVTSWTDDKATMLTTYYYRVQSYNTGSVPGNISPVVQVTPDRLVAHTAEGVCGTGLRWVLYADGAMVIMGTGPMTDYNSESAEPWYNWRNQIREVVIYPGVTTVGRSAFGGCSQLSRVTIPSTVTSIGDWAFNNCGQLRYADLEGGVTSIGYAAFRQCASLQEITLPSTVKTIGDWAFSACTALNSIVLPEGLTSIGGSVFYEDAALTSASLPSTLKTIGEYAFRSCTKLDHIAIPAGIQTIGKYAFAMCSGLTDLTFGISSNAPTLEEGAFYNCTGLTALKLPNAKIGTSAFAYCYNVKYVTIQQSAGGTTIGDYAFRSDRISLILVIGPAITCSPDAFTGISADILVSGPSYGSYFVRTEGTNTWRTYLAAGSVSPKLFWYLDNAGMLTILGEDPIPNYDGVQPPWAAQSSIRSATVAETVPSVGMNAFFGCWSMHNVYFPGKAPRFHDYAFAAITATIHYHDADGSWRNLVGKTLGGVLTWTEDHFYSWTMTTEPTFDTAGTVTGRCTCGETTTLEMPKLDRTQYTYSETADAAVYTWKNTEKGSFAVRVPFARITAQPASQTVAEGGRAVFAVSAAGTGLKYSWQWKANASDAVWLNCTNAFQGYDTATLEPSTTTDRNGSVYRCAVTDSNGRTVYSEAAKLTVYSGLEITGQPRSQTVSPGSKATFTVTAAGEGLRYQWQWKDATQAGTWQNCSSSTVGYNTAVLQPEAVLSRNGYSYRCVVTDVSGKSVTSEAAVLTVYASFAITKQPISQKVYLGSQATFTVSAAGGDLKYQWQRYIVTGVWQNVSGATAASMTVDGIMSNDTATYRCVITDYTGSTLTTDAVTLRVYPALELVSQPADQTAVAGGKATFGVSALGGELKYQWQWRSSAASGWQNCSSSTVGYNTPTLQPEASASRTGYQYRCVVTDFSGRSIASDFAVLTVSASVQLRIVTQPVSVQAAEDETAAFSVSASGEGLKYQWQWRSAAADAVWNNCTATTAGYNTPNLRPVAAISRSNYQYRCVVTDRYGSKVTSSAAILRITPSLTVQKQPVSVSVKEYDSVSFSVSVTGKDLTYSWQWRASADVPYWTTCTAATPGYNTNTLKPVATQARNGYQYRCKVTNAKGQVVRTEPATMTVRPAIVITKQPVTVTYVTNNKARFEVQAQGTGLKYQWQYRKPDSGWANLSAQTIGYNTSVVQPLATAYRDGFSYRCLITDANGAKILSDVATLHVYLGPTITSQPTSQTVKKNTAAAFHVEATGVKLTYQWSYRPVGGKWADCSSLTEGYNTSTLRPTGTTGRNGYQYRCVITDQYGLKTTSEAVTLNVAP